jgi:hypothetical protein
MDLTPIVGHIAAFKTNGIVGLRGRCESDECHHNSEEEGKGFHYRYAPLVLRFGRPGSSL